MFATAPVIYRYTRAQAIADGVLVDVGAMAREAGFSVPTAITAAVAKLVHADENADNGQSTEGRLWDVLWMASVAGRLHRAANRTTFEVIFAPRDGSEVERVVDLELHVGPGDESEPVITIMLLGED